MSRACKKYACTTEVHVLGRKIYRCAWCEEPIALGTDHVLVTEFPGGEAGYADYAGHPVSMRIHSGPPCHYGCEAAS